MQEQIASESPLGIVLNGLPLQFSDLEQLIGRDLGAAGLMLFVELDHGAVLRKETGLDKPKIVRLVLGNPLVMKEMAKHVPDAGSYASVTVLIDEREDGVHLSYDRMVSFLAPYAMLPQARWHANWMVRSRTSFASVRLDRDGSGHSWNRRLVICR